MESISEEVNEWFAHNLTRKQLNDLDNFIYDLEEKIAEKEIKENRELTSEEKLIVWLIERG